MATKDITVTKGSWNDLVTLGSLSLTQGDTYTLSVLASGISEVCIADSAPENTFRGHELLEHHGFTFTYNNEKIWVKLNPLAEDTALAVIS